MAFSPSEITCSCPFCGSADLQTNTAAIHNHVIDYWARRDDGSILPDGFADFDTTPFDPVPGEAYECRGCRETFDHPRVLGEPISIEDLIERNRQARLRALREEHRADLLDVLAKFEDKLAPSEVDHVSKLRAHFDAALEGLNREYERALSMALSRQAQVLVNADAEALARALVKDSAGDLQKALDLAIAETATCVDANRALVAGGARVLLRMLIELRNNP